MPSDYVKDLVDHKRRVATYMLLVAYELSKRAAIHDNSKFTEQEFKAYELAFPELQKHAYGSPEFQAALDTIKPAIAHHYAANDHHPEYFEQGINDMNLVQLVEMACDWLAASERSQKDVKAGLEINRERFGIDEQLYGVIKNTLDALKAKE